MTDWKKWNETNPRQIIPDELKGFLEFAKKQYADWDNVNWTYEFDDLEELEDEIQHYISESAEAILMFIQYQNGCGSLKEKDEAKK